MGKNSRNSIQLYGPSGQIGQAAQFFLNGNKIVRSLCQLLPPAGTTTTRAIAEALNAHGIPTARGGEWHHSTVRNLLARA
jgi:hypothetical protein